MFWKKDKEPAKAPAPQPAKAEPQKPSAAAPPARNPPPAPSAPPPSAARQPAAAPVLAAQPGQPPAAQPRPQPGPPDKQQSAAAMQSLGEIVYVLMNSPEFRERKLSEVANLIVPAMQRDQVLIARAMGTDNKIATPIGIILWALVSDAWDQKLSLDPQAVPILPAADWRGGPNCWAVETIGPPRIMEAMIKQMAEGPFKGKGFKMRRRQADGSVRVETVAPQAAKSVA